jgi:hypothetical protein
MSNTSSLEKKKYLKELVKNQLKTVAPSRRLINGDHVRLAKYIDSSIFDEDQCCVWGGYITNAKNAKKGTYINFYFRKKKVALHRLLYENYVGELGDEYYLKFSCDNENKGKCCNVNHMLKYKYNSTDNDQSELENSKEQEKNAENNVTKEDFIVCFD